MGRIRTLKPEILEDEKTSSLTDSQWRLFVSMLVVADDYGNLRGDPRYLAGATLWARMTAETPAAVSRDLRELHATGLVRIYRVHGQEYVSICGWDKHQRVDHPGKPHCPGTSEADAEDSRESRESVASVSRLTPTSDRDPDQRPGTIGRSESRGHLPASPAEPGTVGTLPGCEPPPPAASAQRKRSQKATRAPKQPSPTAELQRQVIAWWCEEWRAKRKAAYAVNRRDPQFVKQWLEGLQAPPDEAWFRATAKRYLAAQLDQFELTQSGHHSLWWLLDRGMTRFGAAHQTVGYDVAIKKADAEHAARRREEQRAAEEPSPIVCDVAAEIEKAFAGKPRNHDEQARRALDELRAKVRSQ